MKKIIIIGLMFLMLMSIVSAFDVNDTLRINGEYRVGGVLTSADAYVTIVKPSTITSINNESMNVSGVGLFFYDYLIPDEDGEYTTTIRFYNGSTLLGSESDTFDVGDVNNLKFGVCPTGTKGYIGMWVLIVLLIVVGLISLLSKHIMMTMFSGIGMIFMTLIVWGCGQILGYISLIMGIIFIFSALSIKH